MVKLNKNRSENCLAFVSTRARSGSRPINVSFNDWKLAGYYKSKSYHFYFKNQVTQVWWNTEVGISVFKFSPTCSRGSP